MKELYFKLFCIGLIFLAIFWKSGYCADKNVYFNDVKNCRYTDKGSEYIGTKSTTKSGKACNNWYYNFANLNLKDGANNFCRNPRKMKDKPFCYYSGTNSEYCEIEKCKVTKNNCKDDQYGAHFTGDISHTKSGKKCRDWDSPEKHYYSSLYKRTKHNLIKNYCRNPDNDTIGPWCYTTDPNVRWESCEVEFCKLATTDVDFVNGNDHLTGRNYEVFEADAIYKEGIITLSWGDPEIPKRCYSNALGTDYRGYQNITKSGLTCQRWNETTPHSHRFNTEYYRVNAGTEGNYCRNPDESNNGLWCVTTDPNLKFDNCEVPKCQNENINENRFQVWSSLTSIQCQRDLNEFDECIVTSSEEHSQKGSLTFRCPNILKQIVVFYSNYRYKVDYKFNYLIEIKERQITPEYHAYINKLKILYKGLEDLENYPKKITNDFIGSRFYILSSNAFPLIEDVNDEVVAAVSEVGKGKIGFVNKDFKPNDSIFTTYRVVNKAVFGQVDFKPVFLTKELLNKWYSSLSDKSVFPQVVWNAHQLIGRENVLKLIELIKAGMNIIVGIKNWAYKEFTSSDIYSELGPLFFNAGILPKIYYGSRNVAELKEFKEIHLPLELVISDGIWNIESIKKYELNYRNGFDLLNDNELRELSIYQKIQNNLLEWYNKYASFIKANFPCKYKPISDPMKILIFNVYNYLLIEPFGNKFKLFNANIYPGTGQLDKNNGKSYKLTIETSVAYEVYFSNVFMYPDTEITFRFSSTNSKSCELFLNFQFDAIFQRTEYQKMPNLLKTYTVYTNKTYKIYSAFGGIFAIKCYEKSDVLNLFFENVHQIPFYDRRDKSYNRIAWLNEETKKSPWVIVANDAVVFILPNIASRILPYPEENMLLWDKVFKRIYNIRGYDFKTKGRQMISSDIQISIGYMHSGYPIKVPALQTTDPENKDNVLFDSILIRKKGRWGVNHEMGHNLEISLMKYDCASETFNNIFASVGDEQLTGLKPWTPFNYYLDKQKIIDDFIIHIDNGTFEKNYCDWPMTRLAIYIQLQNQYGWEYYRQLFRRYDVLSETISSISSNNKIQLLIKEMSNIAGQNLVPVFDLWRFPIDKSTEQNVTHLPMFMPDDFLTKIVNKRVEQIINKYGGASKVSRIPKTIPLKIGGITQQQIENIEGKPYLTGFEKL